MNQWPTISIENVVERLIDYRGKTPEKTTSGIKLITAKVIKDGRILEENHEYIASDNYDSWMRRGLPQQHDILITTEAPLGEVAQLRTSEKIALAQRVILLRGNPALIDQDFFFQALKAPFMQAGLKARATGTTVAGIKQSELRKVDVPLPPLPTQRKIAAILSAYDDLIENNTRRVRVLEDMARALYREWFVEYRYPGHELVVFVEDEQGRRPKGWKLASISDVAPLVTRGIAPKYNEDSLSLVINQKCIRDQRLSLQPARRHLGKVPVMKQVGFGDVLINSTGIGTLGRVAQVYEELTDCTVDSHVTIVRPDLDKVDLDFFGLALLNMQSHFEGLGVGATGQTELGRERVSSTHLLRPDLALQNDFGERVRPLRGAVVNLERRNTNLRRTRDLLLPRLVSGELDVSNLDIRGAAKDMVTEAEAVA